MDQGLVINLAALGASVLSLGVATTIAIRQARLSHRANQLPVLLDLIYRQRTIAFRDQEETLWIELSAYDAAKGIKGLPEDVRHRAMEVALFYQHLAYLVAFRIVDRDLAVLPVRYRIVKTWEAVGAFIVNERRLSHGEFEDYLAEFEYLALSVDAVKIQRLIKTIGEKVFKAK